VVQGVCLSTGAQQRACRRGVQRQVGRRAEIGDGQAQLGQPGLDQGSVGWLARVRGAGQGEPLAVRVESGGEQPDGLQRLDRGAAEDGLVRIADAQHGLPAGLEGDERAGVRGLDGAPADDLCEQLPRAAGAQDGPGSSASTLADPLR